jgi:hypothetical protein
MLSREIPSRRCKPIMFMASASFWTRDYWVPLPVFVILQVVREKVDEPTGESSSEKGEGR